MTWEASRGRVVRGTVVELAGAGLVRVVTLVRLLIIGRLFVPESYGAFSTAMLVLVVPVLLSEAGFRQYLVKVEEERLEDAYGTAFVLTGALALLLIAAVVLAARPLAALLEDPDLAPVLVLLSLSLFEILLALPTALWDRALRFGVSKVPEAVGGGTGIAALVGLSAAGMAPVMVLVVSHLVALGVRGALVWRMAPARPPLTFSSHEARAQLRFGLPLVAAGLLGAVAARGDDLAVRLLHDNRELGLYTLAFYAPALLQEIVWAVDRVSLPAFAALPDRAELRKAFTASVRLSAALAAPVGFALAAFAPPVVAAVFSPEWGEAAPLLAVFSVAFALRASTGLNWGSLAMATDRTPTMARASALSSVFMVAVGLPLIAWLGPLGGAVYTLLLVVFLAPVVRVPLVRDAVGDWLPLLAGWRSLTVAAVLAGLCRAAGSGGISPLPGVAGAVLFVPVALGVTLLLDPALRRELRRGPVARGGGS